MSVTKNRTLAELRNALRSQFGIEAEDVTADALLMDDLGLDSLDVVELVMIVEETFEVEIHDEEWENVRTVQDVIDVVEQVSR